MRYKVKFDDHETYFFKLFSSIEKRLRGSCQKCMFPGCGGNAIGSHSQQDNGQLREIAEDQHVIALRRGVCPAPRQSISSHDMGMRPKKIGIHKATVFKGFCNFHDTQLFLPIDTKPLVVDDIKQVYALHLRATSFELWSKRLVVGVLNTALQESHRDLGIIREMARIHGKFFKADIRYLWTPLWTESPKDMLRWKWSVLDKNIGVSLTSCINPLDDISFPVYMESYYDRSCDEYTHSRPSFSLTILPVGDKTHVILCWNKTDEMTVSPWVERMSSSKDMEKLLNECIFCKSEDFCMSPRLWDSLSDPDKERIVDNLNQHCSDDVPNIIRL